MKKHTDFSQGSVAGSILRMAGPMILAQLVSVLYSIVDRMYIGHIPGASANALTGVGVTFPVLLMINAFANLFGTGGVFFLRLPGKLCGFRVRLSVYCLPEHFQPG